MAKVYLFLGNEEYLNKVKIERLIKESVADEYNINYYDMEEKNVSFAVEDAQTAPFLCEEKIVVLRHPKFLTSAAKVEIEHDTKAFVRYLNNPSPYTIFIIDASDLKLDNRKEVVKALLKVAIKEESESLSDVEFVGWVIRQFSQNNLKISQRAAQTFLSRTGTNLINASNEIDKLLLYCMGKNEVTEEDVINLTTKELEQDIFSFTNAIMKKNKMKAIEVYRDLVATNKFEPIQLLITSSNNLKDCYLVKLLMEKNYKQNQIAESLEVSPGRAYYLMRDARSLDKERAAELIQKFAELDFKIKSGQLESDTGLEFLLFSL